MQIERLQAEISAFAAERDWEQFHTPKNLVMALAIEAAELMEPFTWLDADDPVMHGSALQNRVIAEVADVAIYLLRLCDVLGIDLGQAITAKLVANAKRYPVATAKGNARKHP